MSLSFFFLAEGEEANPFFSFYALKASENHTFSVLTDSDAV